MEATIPILDCSTVHSCGDLERQLGFAKKTGNLYILIINSVDRVIDLMNGLPTPVQGLAVLGPGSTKVANYIQDWLPAKILSAGFINSAAIWTGAYYPSSSGS